MVVDRITIVSETGFRKCFSDMNGDFRGNIPNSGFGSANEAVWLS